MSDDDGRVGTSDNIDWTRVRLDWIDLLVVVGYAASLTLVFQWIDYRPNGYVVGLTYGPPLAGLLIFRRRVMPPRGSALVERRFTVLGFVATVLMAFGVLVGLFGTLGGLRDETAFADEALVSTLASARASAKNVPVVREITAEEAAMAEGGAGEFEALVAEIANTGADPSPEALAAFEAEVRRELESERRARAKEERSERIVFVAIAGLLAIALIALGGFLDGYARRESRATSLTKPPL